MICSIENLEMIKGIWIWIQTLTRLTEHKNILAYDPNDLSPPFIFIFNLIFRYPRKMVTKMLAKKKRSNTLLTFDT